MSDEIDYKAMLERMRAKAPVPDERPKNGNIGHILKAWGVPQVLRDEVISDRIKPTSSLAATHAWMEQGDAAWCLLLAGSPGVGKSFAAAYWLSKVAEDYEYNGAAKQRWWCAGRITSVNVYSGDAFNHICSSPVLVVDDLGIEFYDKHGLSKNTLEMVIDERASNNRRTLITTNLNAAQLRERVGDRIADRFRSGARHQDSGKSLRGSHG